MSEDNARHAVLAVQPPHERADPARPAAEDARARDELDELGGIASRFDQIMRTHHEDPARLPNEGRYARLARQLLEERRQLADEIAGANLSEEDAEAEFERRARMIDRLAAAWTPDDPLSAQPRTTIELERHLALRAGAPLANDLANDLGWTPLLALPGYADAGALGRAVRTLGDAIFRNLPCYSAMIEAAEENDLDPLGQVQVISTLTGQAEDQVRLRMAALEEFAFPLRPEAMRQLARMPGYRPEIRVCFSDSHSFLTVKERRTNGSPVDADSIYAWNGGLAFYRERPEMIGTLRQLVDLGQKRLALPTAETDHSGPPPR